MPTFKKIPKGYTVDFLTGDYHFISQPKYSLLRKRISKFRSVCNKSPPEELIEIWVNKLNQNESIF